MLYAKLRSHDNMNIIKEITTSEGHFTTTSNIAKAIINHFKVFYNPPPITQAWPLHIPYGLKVPDHLLSMLVAPITFAEVKNKVF